MKKFLIICLILIGIGIIRTDAAKFDWSLGQPTIIDNPDAFTERYDWSLGEPKVMSDGSSTYGSFNSNYSYCRVMTMTAGGGSGGVATTTTAGFPLVATSTIADLKTAANGGDVQLTVLNPYASSTAYLPKDVIFTTGTTCSFPPTEGSIIPFYFENYYPETGEFTAWLKSSDISSTSAKTVLMYYGNASSRDETSKYEVWNAQREVATWNLSQDPFRTGTNISNDAAAAADGTAENFFSATSSVLGYLNGALQFDGANDYVSLGTLSSLDFSTSTSPYVPNSNRFTISAWVYPAGGSATQMVFNRGYENTGGTYTVYNLHKESTVWNAQISDGTNRIDLNTAAGTVTENAWQHLSLAWDGTTLTLYKNGSLLAISTGTFGGLWNGDTAAKRATTIGSGNPGSNRSYWSGMIDDVRVHYQALNSMDILTIYNNTKSSTIFWTFGAEETSTPPSSVPTANTFIKSGLMWIKSNLMKINN